MSVHCPDARRHEGVGQVEHCAALVSARAPRSSCRGVTACGRVIDPVAHSTTLRLGSRRAPSYRKPAGNSQHSRPRSGPIGDGAVGRQRHAHGSCGLGCLEVVRCTSSSPSATNSDQGAVGCAAWNRLPGGAFKFANGGVFRKPHRGARTFPVVETQAGRIQRARHSPPDLCPGIERHRHGGAGHENANRPVKSNGTEPCGARNKTSAIPSPSLPGSQAATKASDALISGLTHSGRPDMKMLTVGTPAACSRRRIAKSVLSPGENSKVSRSP